MEEGRGGEGVRLPADLPRPRTEGGLGREKGAWRGREGQLEEGGPGGEGTGSGGVEEGGKRPRFWSWGAQEGPRF